MTISLTTEKTKTLRTLVSKLLTISKPSIRFLAKVIGTLISALPAVKYGLLYYRNLENEKTQALQKSKGNFDAPCEISILAKQELIWWKQNAIFSSWICPPEIELDLYTDASSLHGVQF